MVTNVSPHQGSQLAPPVSSGVTRTFSRPIKGQEMTRVDQWEDSQLADFMLMCHEPSHRINHPFIRSWTGGMPSWRHIMRTQQTSRPHSRPNEHPWFDLSPLVFNETGFQWISFYPRSRFFGLNKIESASSILSLQRVEWMTKLCRMTSLFHGKL